MTTTSTDISKAQKIFNEKYVVNRKAAKKLNLSSLGLKGDLVVKDFEKLKSLKLISNKISSLAVINCPNLENINASNNELSFFDVSKINSRKLKTIELIGNRELKSESVFLSNLNENCLLSGIKKPVMLESSLQIKKDDLLFISIEKENETLREKLAKQEIIIKNRDSEISTLKKELNNLKVDLFLTPKIERETENLKKEINEKMQNELGFLCFEIYFKYNDVNSENALKQKINSESLQSLIKKRKFIDKAEQEIKKIKDSGFYFGEIASQKKELKIERFLDTFSRLLTGNETCVATCIHKNEIIIASNKKEPSYAKKYIERLSSFFSNPTRENCENLLIISIQETSNVIYENIYNSVFSEHKNEIYNLSVITEESLRKINEIDWEKIQIYINQLFLKISAEKKEIYKFELWRCLTHWSDSLIMISMFTKKSQPDFVEMIREKRLFYIEDSNLNDSKNHAEMKIVNELLKRNERGKIYIGISKPTCLYCQATISLLKRHDYNYDTYGGEEVHGCKWDGWEIPSAIEFFDAEDVKKWKSDYKATIKKNTTSEIPESVTELDAIPLMKKFTYYQEQQNELYLSSF